MPFSVNNPGQLSAHSNLQIRLDILYQFFVFCNYITNSIIIMAKATKKKNQHPQDSPVIQAGIIFVIVSAIAITAYVFANYYTVGAGY